MKKEDKIITFTKYYILHTQTYVFTCINIYIYIYTNTHIYTHIHTCIPVFLTQIISCRQKNADTKVASSISRGQKWNSHQQFSKNCIFPNIQLKGVVNRLPLFKNVSDHTNMFSLV